MYGRQCPLMERPAFVCSMGLMWLKMNGYYFSSSSLSLGRLGASSSSLSLQWIRRIILDLQERTPCQLCYISNPGNILYIYMNVLHETQSLAGKTHSEAERGL